MKVRWKPALALLALCAVPGIGPAQGRAQSAPDVACRGVLGGSGVSGTAQGRRIDGTLGQTAIGIATGEQVRAAVGFWHPLPRTTSAGEHPSAGGSSSPLSLSAAPTLFAGSTRLALTLPRAGRVSLIVYDLLGKPVRTLLEAEQPEGEFAIELSGEGLAAGRYTAILYAAGERRSVSLVLVR